MKWKDLVQISKWTLELLWFWIRLDVVLILSYLYQYQSMNITVGPVGVGTVLKC